MIKIIVALALLFFCFNADAQEEALPTFITDSLQNYITQGMKDWQIPGLSVAIIKNDAVVYMKGFGFTKVNGSAPVDENTLFMIGSNTKAFTATTLSILQESGALSFNDKVQKWMPEFSLKDTFASKEVNIVDLLSHRIGFETFQGDFTAWTSTLSRAEVIQRMSLIEAPYSFRTRWGYCNAAYVTAGELIPRVINKSWEETVKDSILIPLKMNRTLMLADELENISNSARPHTTINNSLVEIPIANINNLAPAGSMSSSAEDMTKWLFAQLNNGKVNGKQVLSSKSIRAIRRPSSILGIDTRDNKKTHFYLYAMGLDINDRDGKLVYSHTGGVDGFFSSVLFVPEENLGIVVLTNTDQNNFYQNLTDEIRDAFLELPYQGYSEKSLKGFKKDKLDETKRIDSLKKVVALKSIPSLSLKEYSGKYINDVYGAIEVKLENSALNIYFSNHPKLIGRLEHIQNDTYLCTYSNPTFGIVEIPFKIEKDTITGLTLRVADFIEFTPYEFRKAN
ncbi:MAG: CubicO group peptidase (beta-lactamase class C family) [Patiriisocius sp.]|jgi:CubicO group peptidase (beta-lactamase class C family)